MAREKYQKKILELFKKSPVVNFKSIEKIVGYKEYTKQLIKNLIKGKKIKRIGKGFYTMYEDSALFVYCLNDSYLGLQSALSFYGLWEQETIPIIVTPKKVRQGIRVVNEQNVLVKRVNRKYSFGIEYKKDGRFYLPYSDLEKTFIDFFYFNEDLDREIIKKFKERINNKKLKKYLKEYSKRFQKRILNVLLK